jgi:ligand-binding SRPBCC domain-containing protein
MSAPTHLLERDQWIPAALDDVFAFFSDARNLERITPAWLGFRILTPGPIEMAVGARIDYRIRLAGVPLRWRTRIREWKPGEGFVDEQESGTYALWRHSHVFRALPGGVLMTDRVEYRLPLGLLGRLAHGLAVRASLAAIFDHRFARIREIFP